MSIDPEGMLYIIITLFVLIVLLAIATAIKVDELEQKIKKLEDKQ